MIFLKEGVTRKELIEIAESGFGEMVKAVVDIDKGIVAIDAELHSDLEAYCLEHGSKQEHLWGINYYPELEGDDFIEYDSLINIRPSQGNNSRGVEDKSIRERIIEISNMWIKE